MAIVVGLHAAAARAGLPRTSLRRLIAKGQLSATKASDGTWTFDADELDQLRATRAESASAGSVVPTSPVSTTVSAPTATPSAWVPPAATVPFASWMTDPVDALDADEREARDAQVGEPTDDEDAEAQEPYLGIPLGATRSATPTSGWPYTAVIADTNSPRVAELEQQLADTITQRDRWYRAARIKSIADTVANEAMAASGDIHAAQAAAHAAAQALSVMPLEQLALDSVAIPLAQHIGHESGAWWSQTACQHRSANDIERARARRRRRSLRW